MFNIFEKKTNTATLIGDIKTMTERIIANTKNYTDITKYIEGERAALNNLVIQALLGCTIDVSKAGDVQQAVNQGKVNQAAVKFNLKMPTMTQVAEIATILREFMPKENLILARMNAIAANEDPEQVQVPSTIVLDINGQPQHRVRMVDKPNNKKLRMEIFQQDLLTSCRIDDTDCYTLAAMGEQARINADTTRALIIGGSVIILTAAGVGGYLYYEHCKEKKAEESIESHDGQMPEVQIDAGDGMPEVQIDGDADADMPQVAIE